MNSAERINPTTAKAGTVIVAAAFVLCTLGLSVLFTWHTTFNPAGYRPTIILMAYNTAICIVITSLALFGLKHDKIWLVRICAVFIGTVSGLRLVEILSGLPSNIDYWFISQQIVVSLNGGLMSPPTATCLLLIGSSLILLSINNISLVIPSVFLNLVGLSLTLTSLLGRGIGFEPAFVWLGIVMPPHTAIGLSICSLSIIYFSFNSTNFAFDRLSFFSRITTGFGFMAILVIAIGTIAHIQIHTVSDITHQLYKNPLQINNASMRIKNEIILINRQLRDLAIRPEGNTCLKIRQELPLSEDKIRKDIDFIEDSDPTLTQDIRKLRNNISNWQEFAVISCQRFDDKAYTEYASGILHDGQTQIEAIEANIEKISSQAQIKINALNSSVEEAENEAKILVLVIVISFLVLGASVAIFITKNLTHQLQRIRDTMLAIADERLAEPIPFLDYAQEIGDMAHTLEIFKDSFLARKELETRLLRVIEAMPIGVIMINTDGTIEIINTQTESIFGYERSELMGISIEQLIPSITTPSQFSNGDSIFDTTSPLSIGAGLEFLGVRRDKTDFPLELGFAPVVTNDGFKIVVSIADITERKKTAFELNESRDRLELTTRINQIGVWEMDLESGMLIWNDAMFDIYGRKKEYFTNDFNAWRKCVHPSDIENTERVFQEAITKLTPYFCKFRIVLPDGSIKHIHAKAIIEHVNGAKKLRVLGTNIDITREELAIAKIHNLEALRSAIVESSEDAIISKTITGIITSWNIGAFNMFGYSAEEAIGCPIKELVFPEDLKDQEDMLLAQVRTGTVIKHFETVRRCKDGRLINVSLTLSPIKDSIGNIIGVSAIKRDITDTIETAKQLLARKRELELSNRELERSNKELETFAYIASHDLKSPLRGIAQLSSWIDEDLAANEHESVIGHTELLRNRIKRMEKLLDDLLIFYRAGKTEGELMVVDLTQMVSGIFEIQNNKPGLRLEIIGNLPSLTALSTPLELVIRNLFSNAIKHHDKDEGIIQVRTRELNNNFIEISVSDDGPGVPEAFHNRIFGMFQTLKPRDEIEGSGMGLALIKKIVENYGGYITIHSVGRGCRFSFSWPIDMRRRPEND